jgi:hypothetical protein
MEEEKTAYQELFDLKEMVRDEVKTAIDEFIEENPDYDKDDIRNSIDDNGRITEMVDSSVPIYNYDIMKLGTLTEVWAHENELGPAFDGTPTPVNTLATAIYEILQETAWEYVDEYLDELENDGKFDEEDEDEE